MRKRHADGFEVTAESQPRLVALVAEAARAAGTEPPDEITVSLAPRAAAVELRGNRRGLVIGLSLFALESAPHLRELVALAFGGGSAEVESEAWSEFWLSRVAPALDAGRLPPVLEGLSAVLPAPHGHSLELLDGVEQLERDVIAAMIGGRRLEPMAWSEFGAIYLSGARQSVADAGPVLKGLTVAEIGDAVTDGGLVRKVERQTPTLPPELAPEVALQALTDALVVALADAGWEVVSDLDTPLVCRRGDQRLEPLEEIARLADGTLSATAWTRRARELGIAGLPLGR